MPAPKKKQSLFSKINSKSPKTRGIIILATFAVIGGGVMVFRSFAATGASVYTVGNGNLKAVASHDGKINARPYTLPGENGKAGETIMILNPSSSASAAPTGGVVSVSTEALGILPKQAFKLCITQVGGNLNPWQGRGGMMVRFSEKGLNRNQDYMIGGNNVSATTTVSVPGGKFEHCTQVFTSLSELRGPVALYYDGNTTMNLSAFTIYQLDAPAPATNTTTTDSKNP